MTAGGSVRLSRDAPIGGHIISRSGLSHLGDDSEAHRAMSQIYPTNTLRSYRTIVRQARTSGHQAGLPLTHDSRWQEEGNDALVNPWIGWHRQLGRPVGSLRQHVKAGGPVVLDHDT